MENINQENPAGDYLKNLLHGNRRECSNIAKIYFQKTNSFLDLYEKVLKVALYDVGLLWETNKITVATEHLSTAITEGILNEFFDQIVSVKSTNKKVVVACVEGEEHQVGIKMVADVFEMNGWESFFLGAGIPFTELVKYIRSVKPNILALSLSVYFNFLNLEKMLGQINKEFPELDILLGGQAVSKIGNSVNENFKNVNIISDLYLLEKYIHYLNSKN